MNSHEEDHRKSSLPVSFHFGSGTRLFLLRLPWQTLWFGWIGLAVALSCLPREGLAQGRTGKQPLTAGGLKPLQRVRGQEANLTIKRFTGDKHALGQLSASVDEGDSYATPTGRRHLLRLAGTFAIRAPLSSDTNSWVKQLTKPGALLADHEAKPDTSGWVIFTAPEAERNRQLQEKGRMIERLAEIRGQLPEVANPVFVDPDAGLRLVISDKVVVCLKPGVDGPAYFGAQWKDVKALPGTTNQFVLTRSGNTAEQVLSDIDTRMSDSRVRWAEPDFLMEIVRNYTPNDTYYPDQWHLNNTGQGGGASDADVDAPEAWNTTKGSSNIVIAIFDDSVQTTHPDLSANIFNNPGDPVNGVDDDNNGYVDDYHGWDFYFNDNNPDPSNVDDTHGTPCAGVAAAVGDNSAGVTGVAYGCRILPVKVWDGNFLAGSTALANALRYAAGLTSPQHWRGADVISISLSFPQSSTFDSAINDAATNGRNGKGCPIFVSSGNGASGYQFYYLPTDTLNAGSYFIEFEYYKDPAGVAGDDRVYLGDVVIPNTSYTWYRFTSSTMPSGWSTYGNANWTVVDDPPHAYGTGRYILRSGTVGNSQYTTLVTPTFTLVPGRYLIFDAWVSSEKGTDADASITYPPSGDNGDLLFVHFYSYTAGAYVGSYWIDSGVPGNRRWSSGSAVVTSPPYPASHTNTIAVGACTDFDYRSDYSQYGSTLDLVTPSSGGASGIYTTDRTGTDGYASGDYDSGFGGTSSSSPLAAGMAALVLSKNPNLTMPEVRTNLHKSCDKIGGLTYSGGETGAGGRNDYYGYGRLNANLALANTPNVASPLLVYDYTPGSGVLELSWSAAGFLLQSQTNGLNVGLSGTWHDYPGGCGSLVLITNGPATPAVFYRLKSP